MATRPQAPAGGLNLLEARLVHGVKSRVWGMGTRRETTPSNRILALNACFKVSDVRA